MTIVQNTWYKIAVNNGNIPCEGKLSIKLGDTVFILFAKHGYDSSVLSIVSGVFEADCEIKLRIQRLYDIVLSLEILCSKTKDFAIVSIGDSGWYPVTPVYSYQENIICQIDNINIVQGGEETLQTVTERGATTTKIITVGGLRVVTGGYLAIPQSLPGEIPANTWILAAAETGFSGEAPEYMYAPLVNGLIPSQYLPGYVDDVLEGFLISDTQFTVAGNTVIPESGKLYINISTESGTVYRWTGTRYFNINSGNGSLVLGETSSTAYPGNKGKIAYDHSFETGNPHNLTRSDIDAAYKNGNVNEPFSMTENINLRFRIPKINSLLPPQGLTDGEWYLFAIDM